MTEFDRPRRIGLQRTVMIRSPITLDVDARSRSTLEPSEPEALRGGEGVVRVIQGRILILSSSRRVSSEYQMSTNSRIDASSRLWISSSVG